jgi:DNA-binding transcriptional LysR family regulator
MELRQLEAFVAVAEEENFTRAATRLYVAQSGLSATIRSLERELHAALFVRTTRRVDLTDAGAALLPEARRTLASARAAAEAVNSVEGLRRGTLGVGVMQASGLFDVAGLLARYRSAYPGIRIRLLQASSANLRTILAEGNLDVVFATEPEEPTPGIVSFPILESPLVVIGRPENPGQAPLDLAGAAQQQLVGFPVGWGIRTVVDRAMRDAGVEPRVDLEVNDTETLLDLVEGGLGIAVVPEAIAQRRPSLAKTAITDAAVPWNIAAQTVAPMPMSPAGRAFWDMIQRDRSLS